MIILLREVAEEEAVGRSGESDVRGKKHPLRGSREESGNQFTESCISALSITQPSEIMDCVILQSLMIDPGKKSGLV